MNGAPSRPLAQPAIEAPSTDTTPDVSSGQSASEKPKDLDIVVTHSSADFDSLAAAVGLAKLRGPRTCVVTPGGENPR